MKLLFVVLISLFLMGCKTILSSYVKPQTDNLTEIKLPKSTDSTDVLYKIGELDEKGCATNFTTVRDSSYSYDEYVPVHAGKGVVLHVNASTGTLRCRGTKAMTLEKGKQYEAYILPFPYVCGVFINELNDGATGDKVATQSFYKGCVKN